MNLYLKLAKAKERTRTAILYMIEVAIIVSAMLCVTIGFRTFEDSEPPVILNEPAVVTAYQLDNSTFKQAHEVHIFRDLTYKSNTPVLLTTELINKLDDSTIELRETRITADKVGTFKTHKLYFVSHLIDGDWCIKSRIYWTPPLSLKEHSASSKESCFLVSDK